MNTPIQNNHLPSQITIEEGLSKLTIIYRWRNLKSYLKLGSFLVLMCLPIAYFIYPNALGKLHLSPWVLLMVFLFLSIPSAFTIIKSFLNKTIVTVTHQNIHIKTIPISWPLHRADSIERTEITQLFVKKIKNKMGQNGHYFTYDLMAILKDVEGVYEYTVMSAFDDDKVARFIEQKIEKYLGIENEVQEGEFNPKVMEN